MHLMKKKLKLDSFFENNSLPMAITSLELVVVAVNKKACELFQKNEIDLVGKSLYEINSMGSLAYNPIKLEQLLNKEIDSYNIIRKYTKKDMTEVEGILTVSLLQMKDNLFLSGIFKEKKQVIDENISITEEDKLTHF